MKRIILLFFFAGSALIDAAECEKLVYSAHPNYPPFHWEQDGRIVGASADVTEIILKELNIPYESRFMGPWKRVLYNSQEGNVDLILGLKNVSERRSYLTFTDSPFYDNPVSVFVDKKKGFKFDKWDDLIGRRGSLSLGDRHGDAFDSFVKSDLTTVTVSGLATNFNLLTRGRTDYFITGLYPGRAFLEKYPERDKVSYLPNPVLTGPIYHGFSNLSSCRSLIPYFNKRLKELRDQGVTKSLMEKNLKKWKSQVPPVANH